MISCIITGHGDFSLGMVQALEMIAGEQEKMKAIPFRESDALESYQMTLKKSIEESLTNSSELLVFTDLIGGTPFNTSMIVKADRENVQVLTGTNLPMLLEFVVQRLQENERETVIEQLLLSARDGIGLGKITETKSVLEEDGI